MTISKKTKKITVYICALLVLLGLLYFFFMQTNRGSSLALYIASGWHAPINIRWNCGQETDKRVEEKFLLPLEFDQASKDLLRGFWYYSYYRECLFKQGYDFKGNPIPTSNLSITDSETKYINPFADIQFNILRNDFKIVTDNELNVDIDDRLHISKLKSDTGEIEIKTYITKTDSESLKDVLVQFGKISAEDKILLNQAITQKSKSIFKITQSDESPALVFLTPNSHIIYISANGEGGEEIIEGIKSSILPVAG
jgi:hypothetical protein